MSYTADVTADLAFWVAGWIRELLTEAPPPAQRSTAEWLLERIDQAALPQNPDTVGTVPEPPFEDEVDPDTVDVHAHLGPREEV